MKVSSYEDAITVFRTILKRYPDTQTRFKAQFRMADALVSLKKEAEAQTLLQSVVKEESPEWSPKALLQIGNIYASQQKYGDAFRAYRQVISDYPDSPDVDRANFTHVDDIVDGLALLEGVDLAHDLAHGFADDGAARNVRRDGDARLVPERMIRA